MNVLRSLSAVLSTALLLAASGAGAGPVVVYNQKIDAKKICGKKYGNTNCSMTKAHMSLRQSDIALQFKPDGQPDYGQVLGRLYDSFTATAVTTSPCGAITEADYAPKSAETTFTYKRKADNELGASTKIDVKSALTAAGVPATQLEAMQAEFEAQYGRKAKSEYNISGRYFRRELKYQVLDQIKGAVPAAEGAKSCGDKLRSSPDNALIYSVAVIQLDKATFVSNVAEEIAAAFAAKVQNKVSSADIASLKFSIKNRIETSLSTELKPEWRVISWDYLQLPA